MHREQATVNGGGDRLDELGALVRKAITKAELAADLADQAREGVRSLAEVDGKILAELSRLNESIGRWPSGPDDPGSGLLGRASRGSFTNEMMLPPTGAHGSTGLTAWPPAVRALAVRYKRPLAVVAAVISVLAAVGQALGLGF